MGLDSSFIGHTYPPSPPYLVGREKIREFAEAIGADDTIYLDPRAAAAAGHPDVVAPPTFAIVVINVANRVVLEDKKLGVDFARVVHGDQRFRYTRPVRAGDSLVCVCVIEDITTRGGHDFLTTRTEVATESGEPVVTAWSRLVIRGLATQAEGRSDAGG